MIHYHLIGRMNACFTTLEASLELLKQRLMHTELLAARLFQLPEIEKGKEQEPLEQIEVTEINGDDALRQGLRHLQNLFIHHNAQHISSKAAVRLPGVLCFAVDADELRSLSALLRRINQLKAELEQIVTVDSGLSHEQRFDFVHAHLHGLITLNAYRAVCLLENPSSIHFGWANKNIIKNVTRDEILQQLEKSLHSGRSVPPYSREEWASWVSREISDVRRLPESAALKIKRPVKVQPIARVWYQEQQKQVQHPCPLPLIAFCLRRLGGPPKIGDLSNYDAQQIKHRHRPRAQSLRLVVKRLHLYTDHDA